MKPQRIEKLIFLTLFSTILFYSCDNFSQDSIIVKKSNGINFMFGANDVVTDVVLLKMIDKPDSSYKNLLKDFNIKYIRFPGGIPVRYFIWNSNSLSKKALNFYLDFLKDRGLGKEKHFSKDERWDFPDNAYQKFILFCKLNEIVPIIQLNTMTFNKEGKIFQISKLKGQKGIKLDESRWNVIKKNIQDQVNFTREIADNVIWEIGNEDYFIYDGESYAQVVMQFTHFIREIDPEAKIIIDMGTGFWGKKQKESFNQELIATLDKNEFLNQIDYFAPHFYNTSTNQECSTEREMYTKLLNNSVDEFTKDILSIFPTDFSPKLFYTEFAGVLKSYNNKNFNTQFHAIVMLNYLMRFCSNPNIVGVLHMGLTQRTNALLWDKEYSRITSEYIDKERSDNPLFQYIPPQTHALKLFFNSLGNEIIDKQSSDNYYYLVSKNSSGTFIQILNFSAEEQSIPLSKFTAGKNCDYSIYSFKDLTSHNWDVDITTKEKINNLTALSLPKFSFIVVTLK